MDGQWSQKPGTNPGVECLSNILVSRRRRKGGVETRLSRLEEMVDRMG